MLRPLAGALSRRGWVPTTLLALAVVAGCQDQLNVVVQQYPQLAPVLGGRAKPSPITIRQGNITGFVFGANGKSQPVPLAFVTTGSVSTNAGNPPLTADNLPNSSEEPSPGTRLMVVHDFADDGENNPVPAERVPRRNPPANDDPDYLRKYVYLRTGEFFLEGVPEGIANLRASFGNTESASNPITTYPSTTLTGINMTLNIPQKIQVEGNAQPKVVEWTGLNPENGISLQVQEGQVVDGVRQAATVTYKPDPPDVAVTLKAPPGSQGAEVRAVSIVFVWSTVALQRQGLASQTMGPITVPIPPQTVPPAQDIAFGPPHVIRVPVGSSSLGNIFEPPTQVPTGFLPSDFLPGLVVANMEFIDERGFAIQAKNFENLQVACILRRL